MADFITLLLSGPLSLVFVVLGLLLFAALFFDSYFGFQPRKETRRIAAGIGLLLVVAGGALWLWGPTGSSPSGVRREAVVVDFSRFGTLTGPDYMAAAAPYLHDFGISITSVEPPGSHVVLANNRALYDGGAVYPTRGQNFLTQVDIDSAPATFTLEFSDEVASVTFSRPRLYAATASGVTHPAWSAHALDKGGREVSSYMEALTRSFAGVPSSSYTLRAPAFCSISAIRFDSDYRLHGVPFAAFGAILIDGLGFTPRPSEKDCDA